ncbi:MAG: RNB domain-containing ribonuclease, partial [Bdellovibrionales bacterium]|nr:RNB domain-containing ribonuclease [Bdellovibrionales bacterium]
EDISKHWIPDAPREDLTHLTCITIDDLTTRDMDDALSIERTASGYSLGVHISDVSALVPPGSALDLDAKSRGVSLYLPESTINMLPDTLSEDKLSLVSGEVRLCISFLFELDSFHHVVSSQIKASRIRVRQRLSYDQVDAVLERRSDESLEPIRELVEMLYQVSTEYEAWRIDRGALKLSRKDVNVFVRSGGDDFELVEFDEASPARSLVGELMVLANSTCAEFCAKNDLVILYRGQPSSEEVSPSELNQIPSGPAYEYALRSKLKRSVTAFSPQPHASLGLNAYTQATSPIRRYADLCAQRQLLHFLSYGKGFYSLEAFEQIAAELDHPLTVAKAVNRYSKRYWLLKYLARLQRSRSTIRGTVIRTDLKNPIVELEQVYLPVSVRFSGEVSRGDRVELRIVDVDPRYDHLKLAPV